MPKTRKQKQGGKFALSDEKIREFMGLDLNSESYEVDESYWKNIPAFLIANSTIKKMSIEGEDKSSYGIIYQLSLKDGVASPLVNLCINQNTPAHGKNGCALNTFYRNKCFKDVRTFLLKLSFLDKSGDIELGLKKTLSVSEFANESNIQNLCYDMTYNLGESIVPGCISPSYIDTIVDETGINSLLQRLLDPSVDTDGYLKYVMTFAKERKIKKFGLITMEFATGFRTLKSILEDDLIDARSKVYAINLAKASHLLLYLKGVIQGDPHNENVMINLNYKGFLDSSGSVVNGAFTTDSPSLGKALVIDFGRAFITEDTLTLSTPGSPTENYQAIFEQIVNLSMENAGNRYVPAYDWLRTKVSDDVEIFNIMASSGQRDIKLLRAIEQALPQVAKNDALFAGFLENLNAEESTFNDFNILRWTNIAKPYVH